LRRNVQPPRNHLLTPEVSQNPWLRQMARWMPRVKKRFRNLSVETVSFSGGWRTSGDIPRRNPRSVCWKKCKWRLRIIVIVIMVMIIVVYNLYSGRMMLCKWNMMLDNGSWRLLNIATIPRTKHF
jgi:hypothetical protein